MRKMTGPFLFALLSIIAINSNAQGNTLRGIVHGEVQYKQTSLKPDGTCYAQLEDGRELEVKFNKGVYNIPIPSNYKGESIYLTIESLGEKKRKLIYLNDLGTTNVDVIKLKCAALMFVTVGCPSF